MYLRSKTIFRSKNSDVPELIIKYIPLKDIFKYHINMGERTNIKQKKQETKFNVLRIN